MEIRLRIFLLSIAFLMPVSIQAAEKAADPNQSVSQSQEQGTKDIIQQDPVIEPNVKRREVTESDINTENFELEVFAGFLSIEDFGTDIVYGLRLDYHMTEDLFIQGYVGQSEAGTTSFERLGGGVTLLSPDERQYTYYGVGIAYNLLPGEAFLSKDSAYNTSLYVFAGAGSTNFAGDDFFTISWGAGYVVTINSFLTMHMDFRDHMFDISVTGEDKTSHNFEATFSLAYYF